MRALPNIIQLDVIFLLIKSGNSKGFINAKDVKSSSVDNAVKTNKKLLTKTEYGQSKHIVFAHYASKTLLRFMTQF